MLSGEEVRFFQKLVEIIYTNPFGIEQAELVKRLAEMSIHTGNEEQGEGGHHFSVVAEPLNHMLEILSARGITTLNQLPPSDQALVKHGFLFRAYHRCTEELDNHIEQQLKQPDQPVHVPFAGKTIESLQVCGFTKQEAVRYFEFYFQLRRAYYFIDRALVGRTQSMRMLRRGLWNLLFTEDARLYDQYLWDRMEDFSTLLLGETGTGKGAAAAAIGRSGYIPFDTNSGAFKAAFTQAFTATNLSQFPENLIESELFGHRKGAFTGAVDNHRGLFERCSPYGSLFLDEIGDVSVTIQIKLLKVLQERRFNAVGSHDEKRFSGRIIAATNRSLDELVGEGKFRTDFFYRVSSQVLEMPSLRQRLDESSEELNLMVRLLLGRIMGSGGDGVIDQVLEIIQRDVPGDYSWPGNVRELEQVIRRALLAQKIDRQDLFKKPSQHARQEFRAGLTARALMTQYCNQLFKRHGTYEAVARESGLDRRTVKKYIEAEA